MREFPLLVEVPLEMEVKWCDLVSTEQGDIAIRFKGTTSEGFGAIYMTYDAGVEAMIAAGLITEIPVIPEDFPPDAFRKVEISAHLLRMTRQAAGDMDLYSIAVLEEPPRRTVGMLYLETTDFVFDKVVPRYKERGYVPGPEGVAAMVATLFIQRVRNRSAR